jgi:signal transduction histidine kinase
MIAARSNQGQAPRPRLVPLPDGYAHYVDRPQDAGDHGASQGQSAGRAGYAGRRRKGGGERPPRQWSIRSTITILLITPLAALIALYAYAATGAIGAAIAYRTSNALSADLGTPLEVLLPQLFVERSDTFVWQSSRGRTPRAALDATRALTDKAVAKFRVGAAAGEGRESASYQAAVAAIDTKLGELPSLRAQVNTGAITPLGAFQAYNTTVQLAFALGSAQANPGESTATYQLSRSEEEMGQVSEGISQEAALVAGALASGGTMSVALHRQFVRTVDDTRQLEQFNSSPLAWPQDLQRYTAVYASKAFEQLKVLEDKIIAASPGSRLPVTGAAWQATLQPVMTGLVKAETATALSSAQKNTQAADTIILRLVLVGGAGLIAVVLSCVLLLGFGNRISRELTRLRAAARALAGERLPSVVSRLRAGDDVDVAAEAPELDLGTRTREVTDTANAFSTVQRTAVEAAVNQAQLRKRVNLVFRSLARRNQSLLQRQLRLLDEMERGTDDPDALERLFRLDHLTTRMRRQAEGLIVLSGASPGRVWKKPVPVLEVLRGAASEIEDYARVDLLIDTPDFVHGSAVADITHILAELVENAVQCSPPDTRVQTRGGRVASGYVFEIDDRGLGIPPDTMAELNQRLARPPEFDLADDDRLGLFVVSRLAARHGVKVSLGDSVYGGTRAVVLLPSSLVVAEEEVASLAAQAGVPDGSPLSAPFGTLPRRQVGAGRMLPPQETRPGAPVSRSPEQARKLMSAIQQGVRESRARPPANDAAPAGPASDWQADE